MYPLDGGKVLMHGLRRWTSFPNAERWAARVGVVVAVAVAIAGLMVGEIFIALIAGFALMQSVPRAMAR
jgi:Zn-dependent protease